MKKWSRKKGIAIALSFTGAILLMARFGTSGNVAQTAPNHAEKELRTRHYRATPQEIAQQIQTTIPALKTYGSNWKIINSSTRKNRIEQITEIKCEVPVLFFTDDLVITIKDSDKDNTFSAVDVRSASRVGKSDMGENRRHVLQLLRNLDKIESVAP